MSQMVGGEQSQFIGQEDSVFLKSNRLIQPMI
jgi:hypothetical protein